MNQDELIYEDRLSRFYAAWINIEGGMPVDEAMALHGVTDAESIRALRYYAAEVSIAKKGMTVDEAVALHKVTYEGDIDRLRYDTAQGSIVGRRGYRPSQGH